MEIDMQRLLGAVWNKAWLVSMVAIRFLTDFVKRRGFTVFGWYRIALGVLVLLFFGMRGVGI